MKWAVLFWAGCGFSPVSATDGNSGGSNSIIDDTAVDFTAGTADSLAVDTLGLLVPDAYATGGLHARGYTSVYVNTAATWASVQAALGTPSGEQYASMPTALWGDFRPYGLGLNQDDAFTVVYDGEIYLAGPTIVQLSADDQGIVEIEAGTTVELHVAYNTSPMQIAVTPPSPGWYPIHGAVSDSTLGAHYQLSTVSSGGVASLITPAMLRANVTAATGVIVSACNDEQLITPNPETSFDSTLVERDWNNVAPSYDFNMLGPWQWSLRYGGQLRIDEPGPFGFSFQLGSDPTHSARLMIDGTVIAGQWPGESLTPNVGNIQLAPGWHDVLVDFSENFNEAQIELDMSSPAHAGAPIPAAQLRPVRTRGLLAGAVGTDTLLSAPGTATSTMTPTAPAGALLEFADFYVYDSAIGAARTDEQVSLVQGTSTDPLVLPATPAWQTADDYFPNRTAFANQPDTVAWTATFIDSAEDFSTTVIGSPSLSTSYHGGPNPPFAQQMTYISSSQLADQATRLTNIHVTGDLQGATLAISVRTAPDQASLDAAAWTDVMDGPLQLAVDGPAVQYRLVITSDGWSYPAIDKVEIDYATR